MEDKPIYCWQWIRDAILLGGIKLLMNPGIFALMKIVIVSVSSVIPNQV